jgi:NADPH2:quinone reductase
MKAIQLSGPGGPEVLRYVELPTPKAGPHDVLVKAHAIGVSMPELLVRRGSYPWMPPLPAIPGIEMSGVVVEAGAEVRSLRAGQAVYVSARELPQRCGCYAEYISVPAAAVYPLPEKVEHESAATLSSYQVAYHLLHSATRGFRYESVMVQAAGGGIGMALVQLASKAGKRVVAIAGSAEKTQFALAQGAAAALNYREPDLDARIAHATGGKGVDLILDPVGGRRFGKLFEHLAPLGLLVLYGYLDGWPEPDLLTPMKARFGRSPGLRFFSMHSFDEDRAAREQVTTQLLRMLAEGAIRPHISRRLPLAEAARAHALMEAGNVIGKLVLKP